MSFTGCPDENLIRDYVLGKVNEKLLEEIATHIDGCEACEAVAQKFDLATDSVLDSIALKEKESQTADTAEFHLAFQSVFDDSYPTPTPKWLRSKPPKDFGRYQIRKILGSGAMGTVYLAWDQHLERSVAIKVLHHFFKDEESLRKRFLRESKISANIDHPNICRVYDAGRLDKFYYITMPYIEGVTLDQFFSENKKSVQEMISVVLTITRAMQHAHENGIVHRDLKPGNILINSEDQPMITDFGLAFAYEEASQETRLTGAGQVIGSPSYMAPEQAESQLGKVGPGSDVYSVGVILFELITDQLPFEGSLTEVLTKLVNEPAPAPSSVCENIDFKLDYICLKAMATKPEDRFSSMEEFSQALEKYLSVDPLLEDEIATSRIFAEAQARKKKSFFRSGKFLSFSVIVLVLAVMASGYSYALMLNSRDKSILPEEETNFNFDSTEDKRYGGIKFIMNDPTVLVHIDGLPIDSASLKNPLSLIVGKHFYSLKRDGILFSAESFDVKPGKNPDVVLKTRWDKPGSKKEK